MGFSSKPTVAFLTMTVMALSGVCFGAVYQVGDSVGWNSSVKLDYYQKWASTKSFHVGDILVFSYNPQYENVKQVTHQEYRTCNTTSPIASFNSGNDSFTLTKSNHNYFFLSGFAGHCQLAQKLHVWVTSSPLISPSLSPSPVPLPSPQPSPSQHHSASSHSTHPWVASIVMMVAFVAGLFFFAY